MKKNLLILGALGVVAGANAQPAIFTDLGPVFNTSAPYVAPDLSTTVSGLLAAEIKWYRFSFSGTSGTANFLDIDTTTVGHVGSTTHSVDTEIGLYSSTGVMIANDDDDGEGFYSALTFGNAGPRSYLPSGGIGAMTAANGRDGVLAPGLYWLAVGSFNTVFGATGWTVTGGAADPDRFDVNFRTDAVPEPATMAALGLGVAAMLRRRRK